MNIKNKVDFFIPISIKTFFYAVSFCASFKEQEMFS